MIIRFKQATTSAVLGAALLAGCKPAASKAVAPVGENVSPSAAPAITLPETVSFNEHIQPILSEKCYHCHGPDSGTRAPKDAPLRLDREEDAFAKREDGKPVILPGNPKDSALIHRILEKDPDLMMPPPESHKDLGPGEVALIEKWIEQGAKYEPHWAFVPVKRPEVPTAGDGWAANPIDRFIAGKLDQAGLKPNPPEDPRRFYRRLHFDLTGLPPAPQAVDAFEKAAAVDFQAATSAAANELLATTESAENFARHWLDAARYADTHGIHIDNFRSIWPYRDWVVRAFKQNMPWDQFTTEQIAGDLLPTPTLDQQVATGFSRCVATSGEGGAIPEEYESIYAKDRVETVSAVWLGLTTGCAACHDHKFDPISTKEFYSLTAFFRNTTMSALDGNNASHPPNVFVPLESDRERIIQASQELADAGKQLEARKKNIGPDFEEWLASAGVAVGNGKDPALAIHLPLSEADGPLHGTVEGQPAEWPVNFKRIDAALGKAPVLGVETVELGDIGGFSRGEQVSYGGFLRIEGTPTGAVIAKMNPAESFRGWDLYLQAGRPASHVIDTWEKSASKTVANEPLKPDEWHHVMVTFDGSRPSAETTTLYVDGTKVASSMSPNNVGNTITTAVPLTLGSRSGGDSKVAGKVAMQDFRFYRRLLTAGEVEAISQTPFLAEMLALAPDQRTKEQKAALLDHYLVKIDAPAQELRKKMTALKGEIETLRAHGAVSLVMAEKKSDPFAHVLTRGVYSDKGERVIPTTPAVLPPMGKDEPRNRLGLADWLNDPGNPLPARVTMNRTWYYFFGTGIVETNSDFGIMGAAPSHPKLLDWLAAEFVESKWDYRHMLKLIVTSSAYRQSDTISPEQLQKDPANRLISRGPRFRLDAEEIRDMALASSGLLSPKIGGPPVKPYQPEGIWEAVAMKESNTKSYKQDTGESLYRRSIYTLWKRTASPPSMEILDAPTREVTCVRRDLTNTPLQALVLMNDPQFVEASRVLASHALKAATDFDARLDFITRRLDGRSFKPEERAILRKALDFAIEDFRKNPGEAGKLASVGETPPPPGTIIPELAAWTLISSQILNLDETITH